MSDDSHMGATDYFQVDSVTIKPLYPVLDEFGQSPGFDFPLILWSPGATKANPCTIDMTTAGEIEIHITPKGEQVTFSHVEGQIGGEFQIKIVTTTANLVTAQLLSPASSPNGLPWGLSDEITWTLTYVTTNGESHTISINHFIEIYAVTPYAGNYRTLPPHDHGMPREALYFYLIHGQKEYREPIDGIRDYVASIVYAVHYCTGFAYNITDGAVHFAGAGNGDNIDSVSNSFNVRQWALLLRFTSENEHLPPDPVHYVNCYDQAAAVWTGIALALDESNVNQLIWRFAEPFGYINKAHLVGWPGTINSPYLIGKPEKKEDAKKQLFGDEELFSKERSGFWNHAFLQFGEFALDATAGPHTGTETLEQYLNTGIDFEAGLPINSKQVDWVGHINRVSTRLQELQDNLERIKAGEDKVLKTDLYIHRKPCEDAIRYYQREKEQVEKKGGATFEFIVSGEGESKTAGRIGMSTFYLPTKAPIDRRAAEKWLTALGIEAPLAKKHHDLAANRSISVPKLLALEKTIHDYLAPNDSDAFSGRHDVKPSLHIMNLSPDFCHFSWRARASNTTGLLLDIYVLPNYDDATKWFGMRTNPPSSTFSNEPLYRAVFSDEASKRRAEGTSVGQGAILRATGNVVFEVRGFDTNAALKPLEEIFTQLLESGTPDAEELGLLDITPEADGLEKDTSDDNIDAAYSLKKGMKLKVKAKATNGFGLRCNLKNYRVLVPLQLNPEVSKDNAEFDFLARNSGEEILEFVASGEWLNVDHMRRYTLKVVVKD